MELRSAEIKKINSLIVDWLAHPDIQELEATFGPNGSVDATTFLSIAQRLQLKGYEPMPQDDRLSILTPNNIRLSLQGLGVLQTYCRDDTLQGKEFTALIKDRTSLESNLDLAEYEMRIKSRREIALDKNDVLVTELIAGWPQTKKAFRLVKRWTFQGNGMRIDMSMVRSTPKDSRGEFRWQRRFLENNLFEQPTIYEVEVELLHGAETDTQEKATKCFVRGIGEILRAIQGNTLLIQHSVSDNVLGQYRELMGTAQFRGVAPVTLEVKNMSSVEIGIPNIRNNYNVTDKADGLRTHGFCNSEGELFLLDMSMKVYRTGLASKACAKSLVDGEWVTRSINDKPIQHFLLFDIYVDEGLPCSSLPFATVDKADEKTRWFKLQNWMNRWTSDLQVVAKGVTEATKFQLEKKEFLFADPGNPLSIFTACASILDTQRIYHTDGVILTPNLLPLPDKPGAGFIQQFKWKPAADNSIDFLITYQKDPTAPLADEVVVSQDPLSGVDIRYKIMRLYVNSNKDATFDDPRNTVLNELPLPPPLWEQTKGGDRRSFKPMLFNPMDYGDTMVNTCYVILKTNPETGEEYAVTKDSDEPIQDNSILECRYEPHAEPGWRWVPMRIRHDKTERFAKGKLTGNYSRTLNAEATANSIWNSIHDPVSLHMIRTGSEEPTAEELAALASSSKTSYAHRKYYVRGGTKDDRMAARGLRDFHNRWIKETVIYNSLLTVEPLKPGKKLLDFSCGQAGDYGIWLRKNALFVLGVDIAGEGIVDPKNGAYRRYMTALINKGRENVPPMVFVIGDSSKPLTTGVAGDGAEEKNMLRSIFGQTATDGPVPKAVQLHSAGILRGGADVAVCMFALHYFFASKETLDGFLANVRDCVAVGGYFAGMCFDGTKVFNMLRSTEKGHAKVGRDSGADVWSIRKEYDADAEGLPADETSIGLPIDVRFISIGEEHREYLVNFDYLTMRMREIGFELLTAEELATIGLQNSTNTFDVTYRMAATAGHRYAMTEAEKEFSFLNRWFIFKRRGLTPPPPLIELAEEAEEAAAEAPVEAAAGAGAPVEAAAGAPVDAEAEAEAEAEGADVAFRLPPPDKTFEASEIFMFGPEVELRDPFKIGDMRSTRWLAPYWQFPVVDKDTGATYPSLEHYWEAMRLKVAGNLTAAAADLPQRLFGSDGFIHSKFKARFATEGNASEGAAQTQKRQLELFKEELEEVRQAMTATALRRDYNVTLRDADWNAVRNTYYSDGLNQRWTRDDIFRRIVERAREQGKYLLYYLKSKKLGGEMAGTLSGVRRANKQIEGGNLIGKLIMEIARFKF